MNAAPVDPAAEQRALRWSMVGTGLVGIAGLGWGLAVGAQVVVFDGAVALAGVLLAWASLEASRLAAAGPTDAYPYGREAAAPLVVAVQGTALLGVAVYGIVSAGAALLAGGTDVVAGPVVAYGAITTVVAFGMGWWLRRDLVGSALVGAEATQWLAGGVLSVGMLVTFGVAAVLDDERVVGYLDPALVIVAGAAFLPSAIRLLRTGIRELLEAVPAPDVVAAVDAVVAGVCAGFDLHEPQLRVAKVGPKLYVEVDHVVAAGTWDVADVDVLRRTLDARLDEAVPEVVWLTVELTTDPTWST